MSINTKLKLIMEGHAIINDSLVDELNSITMPDNSKLKLCEFELFPDFRMTLFFMDSSENEVSKSVTISYFTKNKKLFGNDAEENTASVMKTLRKALLKSKLINNKYVSFSGRYHDTTRTYELGK